MSVAFSTAIYESVEELYDNSNLIIIGKIGDYEEVTVKWRNTKYIERHYDVEVKKILSNTSYTDLEIEDSITLSIMVGIAGSGETVDLYLADPEDYEIKKGKYLLFLNAYEVPDLNETIFVKNSPNHLYRKLFGGIYFNVHWTGKKIVTEGQIKRIVKKKEKNEQQFL